MATPIRIKRSAVPNRRPVNGNLQLGELAMNIHDGKLYAQKDDSGVGIGTTVVLLTPWVESGSISVSYDNSVGIGTTVPQYALDVADSINSSTDIKIGGVSVLTTASDEAIALAIALG